LKNCFFTLKGTSAQLVRQADTVQERFTMYICVDFDGTIVDHALPKIGKPVPHAIKWLKKFTEFDAKLILFTMRSDGYKFGDILSDAVNYLKENGIELYGVNENPSQNGWSNSPKPFAHIYIDDAAVGCPLIHPAGFIRPCVNWKKVGKYVEAELSAYIRYNFKYQKIK